MEAFIPKCNHFRIDKTWLGHFIYNDMSSLRETVIVTHVQNNQTNHASQ